MNIRNIALSEIVAADWIDENNDGWYCDGDASRVSVNYNGSVRLESEYAGISGTYADLADVADAINKARR
jgi:hypothetical protein